MPRLTQAEFLAKAVAVHGVGRYDYSQTVFCPGHAPIIVRCPEHGDFEQSCHSHLKGHGCFKCSRELQGKQKRKKRGHYIELFQARHGNHYNYSLLPDSFMAKDRISIICPTHGAFEQVADKHRLHGCSRCTKSIGPIKAVSAESFRLSADSVHGGRYSYPSLPLTIIRTQKIIVRCPEHGDFEQLCYYHLAGGACAGCSWVCQGGNKPATLYFLRVFTEGEDFFKIGITYDTVRARYNSRNSLAGYQYEVLATSTSSNAFAIWGWEKSILESFAHLRYRPKQPFAGATECFSSADEILAIFPL